VCLESDIFEEIYGASDTFSYCFMTKSAS
jgi:hypothetical protein